MSNYLELHKKMEEREGEEEGVDGRDQAEAAICERCEGVWGAKVSAGAGASSSVARASCEGAADRQTRWGVVGAFFFSSSHQKRARAHARPCKFARPLLT